MQSLLPLPGALLSVTTGLQESLLAHAAVRLMDEHEDVRNDSCVLSFLEAEVTRARNA